MAKRKSISKSLRFEVFKRDSFTCQYCGGQAPDVVLHVDHINPVAGGGENDIFNLITSCEACNLGKGARPLSDQSAIAKQKAQLDALSERRDQLEMLLKWRQGLAGIEEDQVEAFNSEFSRATGCTLNETGKAKLRTWLKRHNIKDILDGLDGALATYFKNGAEDPDENNRLAGYAFNMTVRVINARTRYADKPYMRDLFYARAIIRNRIHCNDQVAINLLEQAYTLGAHIDELKDWASRARNWTIWRNEMEEWIDTLRDGGSEQ